MRECKIRITHQENRYPKATMSIITRYGYDNFFVLLGIGFAIGIAAWILREYRLLAIILAVLAFALIAFAFWFFRDPERRIPDGAKDGRTVLSPADGRVVQITECVEDEYLRDSAIQVSIFLSPLDVHVNRYPISGVVEYVRYYPGEYLVAWHPKSSERNERAVIGVRSNGGKILFRQITGVLARRIVFETRVGDSIVAGERFGMMKFGSRMDVVLPKTAILDVTVGQRVRGAETILAHLP
ncbi:Phosphatidylserine decarboxylase proenzyme [bacterium HR20]|nr:Phosphatidylserine decarboxylase proenzyme [bacterium HR20]